MRKNSVPDCNIMSDRHFQNREIVSEYSAKTGSKFNDVNSISFWSSETFPVFSNAAAESSVQTS